MEFYLETEQNNVREGQKVGLDRREVSKCLRGPRIHIPLLTSLSPCVNRDPDSTYP